MNDPETSPQILRALYYPYSRCLHEVDLKRAVLVFDELLFVDPLSRDIGEHPGQAPIDNPQILLRSFLENPEGRVSRRVWRRSANKSLPAWYDVAKSYKRLSKHGIARLVSPNAHLQSAEQVLKYAVLRDLSQHQIQREIGLWRDLCDFRFGWKLHVSRVPRGLLELQNEGEVLRTVVEASSDQATDSDDLDRRFKGLIEVLSWISQWVDAARKDEIILPFGVAYCLILNQALLLSDELQAFPVTDDPLAHAGLIKKIELLHSRSSECELRERSLVPKPTPADLYRVQFFTLGVVSRLIPDEALARLDIDEIVGYRKENADALERFREQMVEVASTVSTDPWKANFQSEILRAIESKILPEIRAVDDQLRTSYEKLFGSAVSNLGSALTKVVAPTVPTMTMATFLGLSLTQIVWLGAAAVVSGVGLALPEVMSYRQERRKIERNGLAFLLRFRKQARDRDIW